MKIYNILKKINIFRNSLFNFNINIWINICSDIHYSEYILKSFNINYLIYKFIGLLNLIIITENYTYAWIDSRYWNQAHIKLKKTGLIVIKQDNRNTIKLNRLLYMILYKDFSVGIDNKIFDFQKALEIKKILKRKNINLIENIDPFLEIWIKKKLYKTKNIISHNSFNIFFSTYLKIKILRGMIKKNKATIYIASTIDDILWIMNLRGSDINYTPLFFSYILIYIDKTKIYIKKKKIKNKIIKKLKRTNISICEYNEFFYDLSFIEVSERLLIDQNYNKLFLHKCIPSKVFIKKTVNPTSIYKSFKSFEEINNIRNSVIIDGIVIFDFFYWLNKKKYLENNEFQIIKLLNGLKRFTFRFGSLSFSTISSFNSNNSLPHYTAKKKYKKNITSNGIILIDSGSQYLNGTTDITRMISFGYPLKQQKEYVTHTLRCVINFSKIFCPKGIDIKYLDSISRLNLWKKNNDYSHSTYHSLGYFLDVHEKIFDINYDDLYNKIIVKNGLIFSNEPGIYSYNNCGSRIENIMLSSLILRKKKYIFCKHFIKFETLTISPIDMNCIDYFILNKQEIQWLNSYHILTFKKLKYFLNFKNIYFLSKICKPVFFLKIFNFI